MDCLAPCGSSVQRGSFWLSKKRAISTSRTAPSTIKHVESFLKNLDKAMAQFKPPLDHFVNADETLLRPGKDIAKILRIESGHKTGGSETIHSKGLIGSMTPFVSAEGTTWLLVFCLKIPHRKDDTPLSIYILKEEKGRRSQNSPLGTLILGSSSGLLDSKLWEIALLKFIEIVRTCSSYPSREIVLILGNLGIPLPALYYQESHEGWVFSCLSPSKHFPLHTAS